MSPVMCSMEYNTEYDVEVTAINSCGIPSQPAVTIVFIDARGQWNIHKPHGIFTVLTFLSSSTSAQTAPSSPLLWCSPEKWQTSCHQLDGGPLLCTVAITSLKFVLGFIQYGEREEGVVYPGEKVVLELSPGGAICPDLTVTDTSCTTVITSDWNNYIISLTLYNDVGASPPVTADFDRECFL